VQQHADWANKGFTLQINSILENFTDPHVLDRLMLQEKPTQKCAVMACQDDATHFVTLCLQMCMQRAWSMSSNSSLQPNAGLEFVMRTWIMLEPARDRSNQIASW